MIYLTWLIMDSSFLETSSTVVIMSEVYCLTNATGLLTSACFSFLSSMHQFRAAPESLRRLRARLLSLDSPTKRTSSDTNHLPRSRTARRFFPVCTCWQLIHCHPIVRPRAYTLAATVIQSFSSCVTPVQSFAAQLHACCTRAHSQRRSIWIMRSLD